MQTKIRILCTATLGLSLIPCTATLSWGFTSGIPFSHQKHDKLLYAGTTLALMALAYWWGCHQRSYAPKNALQKRRTQYNPIRAQLRAVMNKQKQIRAGYIEEENVALGAIKQKYDNILAIFRPLASIIPCPIVVSSEKWYCSEGKRILNEVFNTIRDDI